jgi:CrcB protein
MLAPPGAILRWWAAAVFNPRSPQWIKWGTWGVNMVSTALLGVAYLLQRRNQGPGGVGVSVIGCGALQAIQDGFCGCLSTIPSFLEVSIQHFNLGRVGFSQLPGFR